MKKIPTIFERDWDGDRSRVLDKPHPVCNWVFDGEGVATVKLDGTCCMVRDGKLYKRRELGQHHKTPLHFELVSTDHDTGKRVGWLPVHAGPEDQYHLEAFRADLPDGTYELVGPKIQGGVEKRYKQHHLVAHNDPYLVVDRWFNDPPRTFSGLLEWFKDKDIEGLVFHHPDGRMAKIKKRDFGLKRRD